MLASGEAMEDLLSLEGAAERAAGSSEIAVVSSSDQGTEPGWPRVFHCDLNEDAELPLLAEPRLGAEQVGGLYAGEEVTAVGQYGDWLHVRLYEYEEDGEEDKDDDEDVSKPQSFGNFGEFDVRSVPTSASCASSVAVDEGRPFLCPLLCPSACSVSCVSIANGHSPIVSTVAVSTPSFLF